MRHIDSILADMREADRLAALAKSAANVDESTLTTAQIAAASATVGAFASLATFYATRATWQYESRDGNKVVVGPDPDRDGIRSYQLDRIKGEVSIP